MTTNDIRIRFDAMNALFNDSAMNAIATHAATAILDLDESDLAMTDRDPADRLLDAIELINAIMPRDLADLIISMTDCCPIHLTDIDICADDAIDDCAIFRSTD